MSIHKDMAEFPTLAHPPIVEALLDVQVSFPKEVEMSRLAAMHAEFQAAYPKKSEERITEFAMQQKTGELSQAATIDRGPRGYRFLTEDGKQIIQFRKDGFTFNRLAPYSTWNDVQHEAEPAWQKFRSAFPEASVMRIGLRYINRILIPLVGGKVDLEEYFTTHIPEPQGEDFHLTGFLVHNTFHHSATGFDVNWMLAHQASPNPGHLAVVLDIDVYLSGPKVEEVDVFSTFDAMRTLKNGLFFGSFTKKGLRLFNAPSR